MKQGNEKMRRIRMIRIERKKTDRHRKSYPVIGNGLDRN
jgi:hypothetical protein